MNSKEVSCALSCLQACIVYDYAGTVILIIVMIAVRSHLRSKYCSANKDAYGTVVYYIGSARGILCQLGPAVQPKVVVVYIDPDCSEW